MIRAASLTKRFDDRTVLSDLDFTVNGGSVATFLGPSGCGKTTLLRILAGTLDPSAGSYTVDGTCSMVFQDPRLLPWKTARGNISVLNRLNGHVIDEDEIDDLLELVGLSAAADRYPSQLSGGMQKRVAFARALAMDPDVLLLDEPFSSLDYVTRQDLEADVADIIRARDMTAVFVTHNIESATALGDTYHILGGDPCTIVESGDIGEGAVDGIKHLLAEQYPEAGS